MVADLLAEPGVVETVELGSAFGFMAFHGGSLEVATDTIAAAAAERSGASLYTVAQPEDLNWHVPSKLVDPAASPGRCPTTTWSTTSTPSPSRCGACTPTTP